MKVQSSKLCRSEPLTLIPAKAGTELLYMRGFIDLHTHGIGRYDTRTKNPDDILKMAELHAMAGTSAILPTIYSGTIPEMRANMEAVKKAIKIQDTRCKIQDSGYRIKAKRNYRESCIVNLESRILGVHLEGPFLNPLRCGAQDKNSFIKPTISNLKRLIGGYEGIIKIITIAPELPGALRVIEKCASLGIKVNMGHSYATYREALNGKKAGATGVTHIFNAMRPFHHREPGLVGLGLLDEELFIEVIGDGIHLSPDTIKLIFKIKQPDRITLVSDSIKGTKNKKTPIYVRGGVLAGSSIALAQAVKNIKNLGIPEARAIKSAVNNPARYLMVEGTMV